MFPGGSWLKSAALSRIPEIMARSGAKLVEVGATNRTHLRDYESAIGEETALLLKVHASNFRVIGFTSEVPLEDLLLLAGRYNLPVMEDLGSGSLLDLSKYGLCKEPTVQEVVKAGIDVVILSAAINCWEDRRRGSFSVSVPLLSKSSKTRSIAPCG